VDIEPIEPVDLKPVDSACNPQSPRSTCFQLRASESGDPRDAFLQHLTYITTPSDIHLRTDQRWSASDCTGENGLGISDCRNHTSRTIKVSMVLNETLAQWRLTTMHGTILTMPFGLSLPALTCGIARVFLSLSADEFTPSLPQGKALAPAPAPSHQDVLSASNSQWSTERFAQLLAGKSFPASVQIHRAAR
jgi:hypothetical protein